MITTENEETETVSVFVLVKDKVIDITGTFTDNALESTSTFTIF